MMSHRDAGLTLVEVLVAVTLLAMLSALIASGVQFGGRAWRSAERQTSEIDDMESIQALLRRTIEAARPALASADPRDRTVAFDGEPNQFGLVVPLAGTAGSGPWSYQRFYVAPRGASQALFMNWRLDAPAANPSGADQVLLEHVAGLRLAYFGPPAPGSAPAWLDRWTGRTSLPYLVRIDIERPGGFRAWPGIVAATRATTNPGCASDGTATVCDFISR